MPGPKKGSEGAKRIGLAHKGSRDHDQVGGFATNSELAKDAGKKGGDAVKKKYGPDYYRAIGKKGGDAVKKKLGSEHYSEIGRRGGKNRWKSNSEEEK